MTGPTSSWEIVGAALALGLSVAGAIQVIRALPYVRGWVLRGVKPWSCDLCMSFWLSLVAGASAAVSDPSWSLAVLGSVVISIAVTGRLRVPGPIEMPPLEGPSDGD